MNSALTVLKSLLETHPATRHLVVAFSGGVDSYALLHWLSQQQLLRDKVNVTAAHIDHGLHPDSNRWAGHCRQTCEQLKIPLRTLSVDAHSRPGESPEAAARHARYQALQGLLEPEAAVLTAHHQDDQAETLLLQLLRGAGPRGLAAMPLVTKLGQGWVWRPLLDIERATIVRYAQNQGLHWIEDASNNDRRLDRNYLRHEILPLLKARWPAVSRTLARSARLCAETATLLDAAADLELRRTVSKQHPDCLPIPTLATLSEPQQRHLLRRWLTSLKLPTPSSVQLEKILHEVIAAPRDRCPMVRWPGCEVRRYRDHLYAMQPLPTHLPDQRFNLDLKTSDYVVLDIGRLQWQTVHGQGIKPNSLTHKSLTVGFRQGGECLRPAGRRHVHTLKKLFQEVGIPPWERDRIPLLFVDEVLAVVVGLWVAADFAARPQEDGLVLEITRQRTN